MSERATDITPISVYILDKEYRVACPREERDSLIASAHHLDARMREIKEGGKIVGLERIAVMAALNIAHELIQEQGSDKVASEEVAKKVRRLQSKIENALTRFNQMEL